MQALDGLAHASYANRRFTAIRRSVDSIRMSSTRPHQFRYLRKLVEFFRIQAQ